MVLGALPLVLRNGDSQLVQPNCTTPAVADRPGEDQGRDQLRLAGRRPAAGPYVLALDAATVTGPVGGPVTPDNGRVLSAPHHADRLPLRPDAREGPRQQAAPTKSRCSGTPAPRWARVAVSLLEVS